MSKEITPTKERRVIQLTALHPRDLVDSIWNGQRDFSYRVLEYPESLGSYVDSNIGSINQYVEQNEDELSRRPLGFQRSILAGLYAPGIKLPFTKFTLADLTGADLSDADLRRTVFTAANLENVSFYGADLTGADLRSVVGLKGDCDVKDAKYNGIVIKPKQVELFRGFGLDLRRIDVRE